MHHGSPELLRSPENGCLAFQRLTILKSCFLPLDQCVFVNVNIPLMKYKLEASTASMKSSRVNIPPSTFCLRKRSVLRISLLWSQAVKRCCQFRKLHVCGRRASAWTTPDNTRQWKQNRCWNADTDRRAIEPPSLNNTVQNSHKITTKQLMVNFRSSDVECPEQRVETYKVTFRVSEQTKRRLS